MSLATVGEEVQCGEASGRGDGNKREENLECGDGRGQQRAEDQAISIGKENIQVTRRRSLLQASASRIPQREGYGNRLEGGRSWEVKLCTHRGSFADKKLLPLTAQQLAAFRDVFKLFSSSPTGSVDMRSMKAALCNVGVQLSPQEMCEALRQADLDGDGIVSFKDFLGVLTDSHRLAQCLGKVRNSWACDPQGLQTLFLEMLFKLMSLGYVPFKSVREVMSYYSKKQRSLRLNASWKGRSRSRSRCGRGRSGRSHAGLAFFCQAARLIGLSNAELARSLHGLHKAGACSPYSQIPSLNGGPQPESHTQSRTPRPDIRLPKSYQPSRPKRGPKSGQLSQGPLRASAGFAGQLLGYMCPSKLAPSPQNLIQKQPFSPSPAYLQRPATKKLYK
ncbi:EF-hand calcium-binding domain-containing protein 3-like [Oryx dammah]|uniref:EF-hand calcium-binding domain-containing protein 3-like n=1 Tax=Oryx dammah TaxID=59534 RepID=UPI001A9AC82A|nr:EF-hand calcium-binding domain-containing protein 3-like [Oryx dammah]